MSRPADRFERADALFDAVLRPGRILELGCGDGRILARLKARGRSVVGIDVDPAALLAARQRGLPALVQGDAERLPFADGSFGTVLSGFFSANLMDRDRLCDEAWRVLHPGGTLAYTLLNPVTRVIDLAQHRLRHGRPLDVRGLWAHARGLGRPAREPLRLRRAGLVPLPLAGPLYLPLVRRLPGAHGRSPVVRGRWTELAWEVVVAGVRPWAPPAGRPWPRPLRMGAAYRVAQPDGKIVAQLVGIEPTARGDGLSFRAGSRTLGPVLSSAILEAC